MTRLNRLEDLFLFIGTTIATVVLTVIFMSLIVAFGLMIYNCFTLSGTVAVENVGFLNKEIKKLTNTGI